MRHRALHVTNGGAQIAAMQIDIDPPREPRIFALQHRRSVGDANGGHIAQANLRPALGQHRKIADFLDGVSDFPWITYVDRKALQAFDRFADVVAADRRRDDALHVGDIQAITPRGVTVDFYVDVTPPGQAFGERGRDARHLFDHPLDIRGDAVDLLQIHSRHLDSNRALDAGGKHVDAVANGGNPDVRESGHPDRAIELLDQLVRSHAGPPLVLRLELDGGLEHLQRRRIGRGLRPAGLGEHARDFGYRLDQAIGLLQELRNLSRRDARQRRWHVQQVTLVQRRHEFTADPARRPECRHGKEERDGECQHRDSQHAVEHRPV